MIRLGIVQLQGKSIQYMTFWETLVEWNNQRCLGQLLKVFVELKKEEFVCFYEKCEKIMNFENVFE